jgi:hypothetical protein
MIYCFCFSNYSFARKGISFSFQGMPQTQLVFEGSIYRIKPGIGLYYDKQLFESHLIVDNDFIFRRSNKLNPFLGIGIKGSFIHEHYYSYHARKTIKLSIEPNFGLQYNFNDNFSVFGNVRLSASYDQYDGAILSLGKTAIGIMFFK